MLRTKLIALTAFAAFVMAPTIVSADAPKVSYSAKKQGRVAFQERTQSETAAVQDTATGEIHPADIEPAAGGYESEEKTQENSLTESMRLPRKN